MRVRVCGVVIMLITIDSIILVRLFQPTHVQQLILLILLFIAD